MKPYFFLASSDVLLSKLSLISLGIFDSSRRSDLLEVLPFESMKAKWLNAESYFF
jgi:hypothetical protein